MSFRNTAEALPKFGGSVGRGILTTSASIAAVEFLIVETSTAVAFGSVGIIVIGISSYVLGTYGGYRIASSAIKAMYDALGFEIITRNCVYCKQEFKFRKYKGERFKGCLTCAKKIYTKKNKDL